MKILESTTENRTTTLKVELDASELATAGEETYKRINKDVVVPGFRKGKAPKQLLINHVGVDAFNNEVYEDYIPVVCDQIVNEQNIEIYARPFIHVTSEDPVVFEAVIPLIPVVELCDYKAVRIDTIKAEVKDEAVDDVINRLRKQNGTWTESDEPVADQNIITMDIDSHSGDEPFIQQNGMPFQVSIASEYPVKGFAEQVIGMKKGEEKSFTLTLVEPKVDDDENEPKSRNIDFKVIIKEIRKEALADLTDDFVKTIIPSCENVEGFKDMIRHELMHREMDRISGEAQENVIEAVVKDSKLEFPNYLLEREIDSMVDEYFERVRNSVSSQEEYDSIIKSTKIDDLRNNYKDPAEKRVKQNLVVSKVMEIEKIETTDEEIDKQLDLFVSDAPDPEKRRASLDTPENRANIKTWNSINKTILFMIDCATADWAEEDKANLAHNHHHEEN